MLARQITEAFPWTSAPAYLVRDNDRAYGHVFTSRVKAMGIRDRPISPGSPWQNGYAERLIGTLRRECLDQMVIFGETHPRRVLSAYAVYYNQARTHLALQKDAPLHREVQRSGTIAAIPVLAGLHHQYLPDMIFGKDNHRSLNKDAPFQRAIQRLGVITSQPILGGLHHQYCRIQISVQTGLRAEL